ncbi:DUF4352 domain-containing protein [Nocardiopsis sp. CC223A]|uniref:DUF4352 domain-containing protein n=1 Tax=Nocardiopsis sp. CC223A TaxID=3044051 RepID=UPI00278C4C05|nr:DUF4352 domain-containing protein [Nocardiopsis sp. CC223A]
MTDREPEEGPQERPRQTPDDPVNHHPPEEWRPGDPEDPMQGGPQPPGEPPHVFPGEPRRERPGSPEEGGHLPPPPGPNWAPPPLGDPNADTGPGTPPPGGYPPGGHPTGGPPEPVGGELSEGPSGPSQAGYEHAGYAPGYGEADMPGAGAGSYPAPPHRGEAPPGPGYGEHAPPSGAYGAGYGAAYPSGGYGAPPGYGPPQEKQTSWGRILGIGCGVLLLLLLVGGGCTAIGLVLAQSGTPMMGAPGTDDPGPLQLEEGPGGAELTAGRTDFEPGPLYSSGDFTSVDVSVRNNGREQLDVNPLYFSVVDASGTLHSTSEGIGMDVRELDARTLVPGQSTSGVITVQGLVEADHVVFEPFYGEPVRTPVL